MRVIVVGALRRWCGVLFLWGLLCGCGRAPLPSPELPLVATAPASVQAEPPRVELTADALPRPEVRRRVLPNGMSVWVSQGSGFSNVHSVIVSRGAGWLGKRCTSELLVLTAHTMRDGGTLWKGGQVVRPLQVDGESISYAVDALSTSFSIDANASRWSVAVGALARTFLNPAFSEAGLGEAREDLMPVMLRPSLHKLLLRSMAHTFWDSTTANALVPMQTAPFAELRPEDPRDCYQRAFHPESTALVIAGPVDPEVAFERAEALFAGWTSPHPPPEVAARAPEGPRGRLHLHPAAGDVSAFAILQPGPPLDDARQWAAYGVLVDVLMRSRVGIQSLIRHQLGASYGLRRLDVPVPGRRNFGIAALVSNDDLAESVVGTLKRMQRLGVEPLSEGELQSAKASLRHQFAARFHTHASLAKALKTAFEQAQAPEWMLQQPQRVAAVTSEDVLLTAKKYLLPRGGAIGVMTHGDFAEPLAQKWPVTVWKTKVETVSFE